MLGFIIGIFVGICLGIIGICLGIIFTSLCYINKDN